MAHCSHTPSSKVVLHYHAEAGFFFFSFFGQIFIEFLLRSWRCTLESRNSHWSTCDHEVAGSHVQLVATPRTVGCQAPQSMGFSRQEYWSGLPFPFPGDLPHPGIELRSLMSPALAGGFFTTSATWEVPACSLIFKNGIKRVSGEFPDGPVVKTPCFLCRGCKFNPWLEN